MERECQYIWVAYLKINMRILLLTFYEDFARLITNTILIVEREKKKKKNSISSLYYTELLTLAIRKRKYQYSDQPIFFFKKNYFTKYERHKHSINGIKSLKW